MALTRRRFFPAVAALSTSAALLPFASIQAEFTNVSTKPFRLALNLATLNGFKLSLEDQIEVAAKAGYEAIEPWTRDITRFLENGGKLAELRKRIEGHGFAVPVCDAFYSWIVDDETLRRQGIEQMKREMEYCRAIGATRMTATCVGATEHRLDDFKTLGERYRTILEVGEKSGVIPQLEMWAGKQTLNCLADLYAVALHSGSASAEFLLDVFHLYKSGSSFESLSLINGRKMNVLHFHDYPAEPVREKIQDQDRVYPGDGVAPLKTILQTLRNTGFDGFLSFEVFNPSYWATNDPVLVAKTGLEKMKPYIDCSTGTERSAVLK